MKKIIDYMFYRYYMVCLKNKEFPRFGATCILAEIIMMAYLFAVLIHIGRNYYDGLFVCRTNTVVSFNWGFLFTQYIRQSKNYNRNNRLVYSLDFNISTLQQKKNKRFSRKISGQQMQYQIFRQGGVKPLLYSTNSRAYSDAVPLSVRITEQTIFSHSRMKDLIEKLKSKNNYELYYSRKIGKSSYIGMEQVCEENCHSLQGD